MQDGGAVLDKAADDFLEALKAAWAVDEAFNINTEYSTDAELEQLSKHLENTKNYMSVTSFRGSF